VFIILAMSTYGSCTVVVVCWQCTCILLPEARFVLFSTRISLLWLTGSHEMVECVSKNSTRILLQIFWCWIS